MQNTEDICFDKACYLIERGLVKTSDQMNVFVLTDLLIKLEIEKQVKNEITDKNIDYNDEIVSIEEVGMLDTIDISVSGDNLFYCNGVLTKNSFGLPATADFMFALVSTDELQQLNQLLVKQLKNRYNDPNLHKRFTIGVDRGKMKLYDLEQKAQDAVMQEAESKPVFDRGKKSTDKFKNLKV